MRAFGVSPGGLPGILTLAVLIILGCGEPEPPTIPVPDPDVSRLEPQVVAAVAEARGAVNDRPSASTWGRLGMVLDAHGFRDEAISSYRQAALLAPADDRWPYLTARVLRANDLETALDEFRKAAELRSRNAAVYIHYGDALLEHGDPASARRRLERALELEPESPWALFGLGRAALLAGDLEDSRGYLERAVAAKPDYREAHSLLAQVAQRLGDGETAELHMWIASNHPRSSAPPDPIYAEMEARGVSTRWATRRAKAHADAGRYVEAEAEFRKMLASGPGAAGDHVSLGAALAGQGRWDEAVAEYRKALELDPAEVTALSNLGQALIRRGEPAAAAEVLAEALRIDPLAVEARLNLGVARGLEGRRDESVAEFRRVLEARPGDLRALNQLAQALAAGGEAGEAAELWRRALAIDPRQLETLYSLAVLDASRGEHHEAIELLRRGMALAPNSSRLALALAWQLATAPAGEDRDGEGAVRLARRVRRAYGGMPEAADVLAAALAESGDFEGAVREAEAAVELAEAQSKARLAAEIRARRARYRGGSTFRQ